VHTDSSELYEKFSRSGVSSQIAKLQQLEPRRREAERGVAHLLERADWPPMATPALVSFPASISKAGVLSCYLGGLRYELVVTNGLAPCNVACRAGRLSELCECPMEPQYVLPARLLTPHRPHSRRPDWLGVALSSTRAFSTRTRVTGLIS
jgi:hypothetical protein